MEIALTTFVVESETDSYGLVSKFSDLRKSLETPLVECVADEPPPTGVGGRHWSILLRCRASNDFSRPKLVCMSTWETCEKEIGFEILEELIDFLMPLELSELPGWLLPLTVPLSKCWISFMSLDWNFSLCITFMATFLAVCCLLF